MLKDLLVGNNKRKLVSATVLLIIAFLIHIKNKKPDYEPRFEKVEKTDSKKKKVDVALFRAERVTLMPSFSQELKN